MTNNYVAIIAWATHRVIYLDKLHKYKDSYAVSQEFCEWTTSLKSNPTRFETSVLKVPDFNKGNRTD